MEGVKILKNNLLEDKTIATPELYDKIGMRFYTYDISVESALNYMLNSISAEDWKESVFKGKPTIIEFLSHFAEIEFQKIKKRKSKIGEKNGNIKK